VLDFLRLDLGAAISGICVFDRNHRLWPYEPGNVHAVGETRVGFAYHEPVHVVTFPANDDIGHSPMSAVLH
jgi:hypothetical protein